MKSRLYCAWQFQKLAFWALIDPQRTATTLIDITLRYMVSKMDSNEPWAEQVMERVAKIRAIQEHKQLQREFAAKLQD